MKNLQEIYESRSVDVKGVQFSFHVDNDPIRGRFIPKTAKDLDHLSSDDGVDEVISAIQNRLHKVTGIKWSHDSADPGAGYSFVPDEMALAKQIESAF